MTERIDLGLVFDPGQASAQGPPVNIPSQSGDQRGMSGVEQRSGGRPDESLALHLSLRHRVEEANTQTRTLMLRMDDESAEPGDPVVTLALVEAGDSDVAYRRVVYESDEG